MMLDFNNNNDNSACNNINQAEAYDSNVCGQITIFK